MASLDEEIFFWIIKLMMDYYEFVEKVPLTILDLTCNNKVRIFDMILIR